METDTLTESLAESLAEPLTLYTTGYNGRRRRDGSNRSLDKRNALRELLHRLDAVLLDIRYSPFSPDPIWRKPSLANVLGDRYLHVPALGNRNYKGGVDPCQGVILQDPVRGANQVLSILADPDPRTQRQVVLLCGCDEYARCHRSDAAEAVVGEGAKRGLTISIVELTRWDLVPEIPDRGQTLPLSPMPPLRSVEGREAAPCR